MNRNELKRRIEQQLDLRLGDLEIQAVSGGDINRAYRVSGGPHRFFLKTNRAERLPMFEAEAEGLEAIRATATIAAPRALLTGCIDDQAFILMTYIELAGRPDPARLAHALAAMHGHRAERFGFARDNTIGSTPQINTWHDDWLAFWREHRLGYQLQLGAARGFDASLLDAGARLADSLTEFFGGYRPQPSLLHGDLWGGNQGADAAGNPVIFDPACYYGDHEADLAMMELFGHPGEDFFAAYHESFPIDPGYRFRRELYNLYHVLNHANLFGGGYAGQALRMTRALLAQI